MQQYRRKHKANNSRLLLIIGGLAFVVVIYVTLPTLIPRLMKLPAPAESPAQAPAATNHLEVELVPADSIQ